MAGHMHHPPYPSWHYISDIIWLTTYISAAVFAVKSNITFRKIFSLLLLFVCISRLALGSGGGGLIIIELPSIVFLLIISVRGIRRPAFNKSHASEPERVHHKKIIKRRLVIAGVCFITCIVLAGVGWLIFDMVRVSRVPVIVVSEPSIPFNQHINVKEGDAVWITLPNNKKVALWGYFFYPDWGERPYRPARRIWKKISATAKSSDRVKSYIQAGLDTIRSKDDDKQYSLFVDNYCIATECQKRENDSYDLSITVRYTEEDEVEYLKNRYGKWPFFE